MTPASKRLLKGRMIADYRARPEHDSLGRIYHDPVITLDNGATLTFSVEETNAGCYGVAVTYHSPK